MDQACIRLFIVGSATVPKYAAYNDPMPPTLNLFNPQPISFDRL